jgi:hypothetical protein
VRHVAIEVRRAVRPPHRTPLTEASLGCVDLGMSGRFAGAIPALPRKSHRPPCGHQLIDQSLSNVGC